MKIKNIKCKNCNNSDVYIIEEKTHKGVYCEKCGKWIKWANKEEYNLFKINKEKEKNNE